VEPSDIVPLAIVDLDGTDRSRSRLAEEAERLDRINQELGFFCVVGHGVSPTLIADMYDVTARFFHQPEEVKARSSLDRTTGRRGWEPAGQRGLGRSMGQETPPDLREVFGSSREIDRDDPYYASVPDGEHFFSGTAWPETPADMRATWLAYYVAMEDLSWRIYRVMEAALDLPMGWFQAFNRHHASPMIANYYPPVTEVLPGQLRAGAHTDYGAFTILYQDDAPGGLQVSSLGGWVDVSAQPGAFTVNIGDLMARWTNDRWVSTLHRVVLPPESVGTWRISIPFFQQPDADAVISCIPGCEGPDGAKYEPITSGRNWYDKNSRTLTV